MFPRLALLTVSFFLSVGLLVSISAAEVPKYQAAGIPKTEGIWAPADYQQAYTVLSKETVPLPQLSQAEGAMVFERIVSEQNLASLSDKNVAFAVRMQNYLGIQDQANNILKLYLSAHNEGRVKAPTELVRLMSFLLHLGSVGIELTTEFIPSIPKDQNYEIRMEGVKKMRAGLSKIFVGLEQSLGERAVYGPKDLSLLLLSMKRELPVYKPMFEEGFPEDLAKKLELRAKEFSAPEDKAILQGLVNELRIPAPKTQVATKTSGEGKL